MRLKYPIGIETFAKIRDDGYVYVDKTEVIYDLVKDGGYYFLSRPRRFGKSLMLSTIEAYFSGRRELFKGLFLDRDDVDWTPRPVLRLNFVNASVTSIDGLRCILDDAMTKWEKEYKVEDISLEFGIRFANIVEAAYERTGRQVVILIDEYDKVLVNSLHNLELHEALRQELRPVFSVLKGADRYIRFAMLTGVSRFSKLSIFSDLNNLRDITLYDRYSSICGFTEQEIRTFMAPGVEELAESQNTDFEGMMQQLKANYDGYHFSPNSPDIYNPFSLLSAFDSNFLGKFWYSTGTPEFLTKKLQQSTEDIETVLNRVVASESLSSGDTMHSDNVEALLFQTGYLTIKGYDREMNEYRLGIPNREVEEGLLKSLLPRYAAKNRNESADLLRALKAAVCGGQPERIMELLESFLADIPYDLSKDKPESYFQSNLYIIFKLLGFYITTEYRTSRGRVDIVMQTPYYLYVMELKLNGSVAEALQQIASKDYVLPFAVDSRTIFRIGVNFNRRMRNIDDWAIQDAAGTTLFTRPEPEDLD